MDGQDAINVIDRLLAAERVLQRAHDEREKLERLETRVLIKKCGDCDLWMKSKLCPKEKNVNGISRGPSCGAHACLSFVSSYGYTDAVARLTAIREEAKVEGPRG